MKNLCDYCRSYVNRKKYLTETLDDTIYLTFYGSDSNIESSYIDEHTDQYRGLCGGYNDELSIGIEGKEFLKSSSKHIQTNTMECNPIQLREDIVNLSRYDNMSTYGCRLRINEKFFDLSKLSLNIQPLSFVLRDRIIETTPILYSICYDGTEYKLNYLTSDSNESKLVWCINPILQLN